MKRQRPVKCHTCKQPMFSGDACNNASCIMQGKTNRQQLRIERGLMDVLIPVKEETVWPS